jgi:hypothetical protein
MKRQILTALILMVFVLSSLAACSGGEVFTFTAKSTHFDAPEDSGFLDYFSTPSPDGYYVLSSTRKDDGVNISGWVISFVDDAGIRRSKTIFEYYMDEIFYAYHGIWYVGGRIYTAYSPASLEDTPAIDLIFDVYDENFNLIKSVTPGTIPRWGSTNIVFDGEYFYYSYDDPRTGADFPYPNSDAGVYRLNTELELIDSVNPTDKPIDPAGIMRLFVGGDGKVYTVFFEEYFFGTRYKMKAYGEGEKSVIIDAKLADADIAEYGDSNFLTYYAVDDYEALTGLGIYGIKPNGKTERIEIETYGALITEIAFIKSANVNGERAAVTVSFSQPTPDSKITPQFVKTEFKAAN